MKTFNFWVTWLKCCSIFTALFGLILALFYATPLFGWMAAGINPPFWPNPADITPAIQAFQAFTIALLGAVMACWAISIGFITWFAFARGEAWAWNCLALSTAVWFVVDEGASLYYGVTFNAMFNLGFLGMLALPLIFTRSAFKENAYS